MKYIRTIFHVNRHSLSTRLRLICDDNLLITIKSIRYDKINLIFALKFFPRPRQQMPDISALQRKSSCIIKTGKRVVRVIKLRILISYLTAYMSF